MAFVTRQSPNPLIGFLSRLLALPPRPVWHESPQGGFFADFQASNYPRSARALKPTSPCQGWLNSSSRSPQRTRSRVITAVKLAKNRPRSPGYNDQVRCKEQQRDQKIPLPMIAPGNAEGDSRDEADDVGYVGDVGVVAGDPAFFVNHDKVVDEVDDCDQTLRREEEPRELERFDEHDASCQRENCGRRTEHSCSSGHEGHAEDKA